MVKWQTTDSRQFRAKSGQIALGYLTKTRSRYQLKQMEFVEFRCAEFTISNYPLVSSGRTLPAERCTILPGRVRPDDRDQVAMATQEIGKTLVFNFYKFQFPS